MNMRHRLSNLTAVISKNLNPYKNLAIEKFLLENVCPGRVFLYLWQNEKTVVCGRNQNIWKECRAERLLKDGGFPARRLSGGGAVFHDLGNLNFTFIACENDYDVDRQLEVIIKACRAFGIEAEKTGRNDITADGAKFSGNAFYKANPNDFADRVARRYHHGTLMVDVDKDELSLYLNADKEKYESKGIDSVKSRVINLKELNRKITVGLFAAEMVKAFGEVYGGTADVFAIRNSEFGIRNAAGQCLADDIPGLTDIRDFGIARRDWDYINKTAEFFASDGWLYRNNIKFNVRFVHRFSFGDLDLRLFVEKGIIKKCALYSDAMDEEYILEIAQRLKKTEGKAYSINLIEDALDDKDISSVLLY